MISFPQEASSHRVDGSIVQYGWFCVGLHHSTPPNSIWARRYTSSKTDGRVRSQNPPTEPESSGSEGLLGKRWLWGKSRNFSTEGCPKSDVLGVGTWKMVTHGFNTNDLWKINFYFEIFIFSREKMIETKIIFRKFTKFQKSKISNFQNFTWSFHIKSIFSDFQLFFLKNRIFEK